MTSAVCPSCGKPAGGKFCRHCGTTLGGDGCARCGAALPAGARFCAGCGASAAQGAPVLGRNERLLWFVGGGALVAMVGGLALYAGRGQPGALAAAPTAAEAPFAAGGTGGAAPDISNMTPRERFDKLFDRVMRAAEQGDEATVTSFSPMALSAYGMLDAAEVDADARYHAALIRLHTGDVDGARALGDTILRNQPAHLFGYVVQGTIARFNKDDKLLAKSYAGFLKHYDAEKAANRPEYASHPRALEEFLKAAREASGKS